jgi:hypothetical protein
MDTFLPKDIARELGERNGKWVRINILKLPPIKKED